MAEQDTDPESETNAAVFNSRLVCQTLIEERS